MTTTQRATSSEVAKRFGHYYDEAMTQPIAIERNGTARVVMLPAAEYERLLRLDHVALSPEELSHDDIRSLRAAQPSQRSIDAQHALDDAATR